MVALSIFQFAVQHRFGHAQQIDDSIVVDAAALGHPGLRRHEQRLLDLGIGDIAKRRMSDRLGVVHHGDNRAVKVSIFR